MAERPLTRPFSEWTIHSECGDRAISARRGIRAHFFNAPQAVVLTDLKTSAGPDANSATRPWFLHLPDASFSQLVMTFSVGIVASDRTYTRKRRPSAEGL
jgi:hypothetical protein